ncbi:acyltransferase [Nonomuraea sp. NPDC049419]|uniref:acyltransferase family protein n=1 Tax=Nonomuraea sp. NPDC049419 TaxID=3155772 RepID=UPI00341FCE16
MVTNVAAGKGSGLQGHERPAARRQTWLDALRGVAVLAVLFEHLLDALFPEVRANVSPWFDFGQYGVMVFFLISGYVVPASLERRGSVTRFWAGRLFRLYPLWILVALAGTLFGLVPVYWELPDQVADHPLTGAVAHVTMMQDFLQVPSVVNVFWTLSYEMVFYLLVTALFLLGRGRPRTAGVLGVAVAGVLVGGVLPAGALSGALGVEVTVVAATGVGVLGLAAVLMGGHRLRLAGGAAVGALAIVLLCVNSRIGAWQSVAILGTMFAGTALYRLDHGQLGRGVGRWMIGLVPAASIAAALWYGPGWGMPDDEAMAFRWSWSAAVAAAWLTFLACRLVRSYAMPHPLVRLGLISYSVYLLHPLFIQVLRRLVPDPGPVPLPTRIGYSLVVCCTVVGSAALSYRYVERPAHAFGRRLPARPAVRASS